MRTKYLKCIEECWPRASSRSTPAVRVLCPDHLSLPSISLENLFEEESWLSYHSLQDLENKRCLVKSGGLGDSSNFAFSLVHGEVFSVFEYIECSKDISVNQVSSDWLCFSKGENPWFPRLVSFSAQKNLLLFILWYFFWFTCLVFSFWNNNNL